MPVRSIRKSYYNTAEVGTLARNILAKAQSLDPAHAAVTALTTSLSTAYQTLLSSRTRTKSNTQTELLTEADRERDLAFRSFYNYVEAGITRRNTAYRTACLAIMEHIELFDRNLINFGYAEQSMELTRFFTEMEKEAAHLTTIGATEWLNELKAAETAFLAQQGRKRAEETAKNVLVPIKEAREQVLNQLVTLVHILNGLEVVQTEGIAALNNEIDEVIEEVETPAKARLTRHRNNETEDEA